MNGQLSDAEQERILRFSVLTPKEYCSVVLNSPVTRIPKNGGAKKLATKRKAAARKPRRALAK